MNINDITTGNLIDITDPALDIVEVFFWAYIDVDSPAYDRDAARAYGLENWAELSDDAHGAWDHVFGRENRLPGYVHRDFCGPDYEALILARQERELFV